MALILNLFVILSTFSCKQEKNKLFSTNEFSISYPAHLTLDESGSEGTDFILKTAKEGENDPFVENINLATKNSGNIKLEDFAEKTKNEISNVAKINEAKFLDVNGNNCFRIVFELTQNNVELTFIQHYLLKNGKIYALTFSSQSKSYDKFYNEMNDVLMSFKLK